MADYETSSKSAKWTKTAKFLLYLATPFLLQIFTILGLKLFIPIPPPAAQNNEGPEFQIYSVSLSTFSTSWWSQTMNAGLNISMSAKNQFCDEKISPDFNEVSVFHNDIRLWQEILPLFLQVRGDESLLDGNFPSLPVKIDSTVADFIRKGEETQKSLSVDVAIRGIISNEDRHESKNWSKNFTAICKNIELQFLSSSGIFSRNKKAEMINEGPIKCESHWKIED